METTVLYTVIILLRETVLSYRQNNQTENWRREQKEEKWIS